jgi:N-acyl-D-aspartate/D-glutamate deacylase
VAIAPGEQCGIADMYELQPKAGVPFTYGALLTSPAGTHRMQVELNRAGWDQGAQVWPQVTPRPLKFSYTLAEPFPVNTNPEFAALMAHSAEERRAAYADPAWRDRVTKIWGDNPGFSVPRWNTYAIDESRAHPELEGRTLLDVAAERGREPFDTMIDLALDEPGLALRVGCVLFNDDTDEVAKLLTEEHCTLGLSDAGAHVGQLCDAPQPTDFLGNWVRDRDVMPVEAAVRKLTGVQADLLGLTDRGRLAPGNWADVVVFDPATVAPGPIRRVRDFPADAERLTADQPVGVRHVVVNGTPIQVDGIPVDGTGPTGSVRPGRVVRSEPRR